MLQEADDGLRVVVVLVLRGLTGLGLDEQLEVGADGLLVVHGHVQEAGQVVQLAPDVSVQDGLVALAAAPEHVVHTAQAVGHLHGLLHLGAGPREDVRVGGGRGALGVSPVREQVGGTPQQLDARLLLQKWM